MNRPEESAAASGMTNEAAQGPLKTVKCDAPCDFEVRGHDEKEIIQIVKQHAKNKHKMTVTDKQVREKMITEPAGTTTDTPR